MAQAIGQAGQVAADFSLRLQHATNIKAITQGEIAMSEAQTNLSTFMATNPDPELWEEEAGRLAVETRDAIANIPRLSTAAQRELNMKMSVWESRLKSETKHRADIQRVREVETVLSSAQARAVANGNEAEALTYLDRRLEAGTISPAQHEAERHAVRADVSEAKVRLDILEDPHATIQRLEAKDSKGRYTEYEGLDEPRRLALLSRARTELGSIRQQTLNSLRDRQNQGEFISQEELQGLVESHRLFPTQAEWIMQGNRRVHPTPEVMNEFLDDLDLIRAYSPENDPHGLEAAELLALQLKPYPSAFTAELGHAYRQHVRPSAQQDRAVVPGLHKDVDATLTRMLRQGVFGEIEPITGSEEEMKRIGEVYDRFINLQERMRGWIQQHPDAPVSEQFERISQELSAIDLEHQARLFEIGVAGQMETERRANAIQRGFQRGRDLRRWVTDHPAYRNFRLLMMARGLLLPGPTEAETDEALQDTLDDPTVVPED